MDPSGRPPDMPAYLTAASVAERWACSPSHVRAEARSGRLVGMRLGSDWRFSLSAVEAYEAAHTAATPAAANASPKPEPTRMGAPVVVDGFALPDDYEPVFPELWGRAPAAADHAAGRGRSTTKKSASRR